MMRIFAINAAIVLSYFFFPHRLAVYLLFRQLANQVSLFSSVSFVPPDYDRAIIAVEGFRHSGNSYVATSLLVPSGGAVVSHNHRLWAVYQARRNRVPVVVLIRPCEQVVRSVIARRSASSGVIWPGTIVTAWLLYYVPILCFGNERFVDLTDLICDPQRVMSKISSLGGPGVSFDLRKAFMNASDLAEHTEVRYSTVALFLLRVASKVRARALRRLL